MKQHWYSFGCFLITFILMFSLVIPVVTRHFGFDFIVSGADTSDAVDSNATDKDSVADTGTETNFANVQNDITPDADYMNIQEADTGSVGVNEDLDVNAVTSDYTTWGTSGNSPWLDADEGQDIITGNSNAQQRGWFGFADTTGASGSGYTVVLYVDFDAGDGNDDCNWNIDTNGDNTPEFSGTFANPTTTIMNTGAISGLDTDTEVNNARLRLDYVKSGGGGIMTVDYAYLNVVKSGIINYTIDFEYNWTGLDFDETSEELCIYYVEASNLEDLNVSYWNITGVDHWTHLGFITGTTGWKNFTADGLDSQYYTIRINGTLETGDASIQDDFDIDVMMMHTWTSSSWKLVETWNITLQNTSGWYLSEDWNITLSDSSSWGSITDWNLTLSNTSGWKENDVWNITLSNNGDFKSIATWNITLQNSSGWSVLQNWNITLSNVSSHKLIQDWNLTLNNNTQFRVVDNWNITLQNYSAEGWNVAQDWNITLSNTSTYGLLQNWNITLSNTSSYKLLEAWNITLSNNTLFTNIETWNITISNLSTWFLEQDWNITLSNTSSYSQIQGWNLTLQNTSGYKLIQDWNITISNSAIYNVIEMWNITLQNTSTTAWGILQDWNITLQNTSPIYSIQGWNLTLSNSTPPNLSACFTYVIDGVVVRCTDCGDNVGSTIYHMWNVSTDDVSYGSTGWILGNDGMSHSLSFPGGKNIVYVVYSVKKGGIIDSLGKVIVNEIHDNRDEFPPEHYYNPRDCHQVGYYWWDDSCHKCTELDPWDIQSVDDLPGAGEKTPGVEVFGWNVTPPIIFLVAFIVVVFLVLGRESKKGKKGKKGKKSKKGKKHD